MRSTSMWVILALLLLWAVHGRPAAVAPQTTTTSCATCHRAEAASQPDTLMAHALELSGANHILQSHPDLALHRGNFTYTLTTRGLDSTYSVTDGAQTLSVPIQWGFGSGAQTWMYSLNGKFYESVVSYFPAVHGLDSTLGDDVLAPRTLTEALGRELSAQDVKSCFGCHATGAIVDGKLNLAALKPGVTCEHCHAGAAGHMADAMHAQFTTIPTRLGSMPTESLSNFCGQCHRSWATVVTHRWFGPMNVRFAPYRLANSKCFNGTDARISCVACHNPHVNVDPAPPAYDTKCLACHMPATGITVGHPGPSAAAKSCPVAQVNCVSCHMPKVKLANEHLTFTDHFIRVVRPKETFPD